MANKIDLQGILSELATRKTAGDQGTKDTTHPTAKAPNSTQPAVEGSQSAETSADLKAQQPVSPETTGDPVDRENPSGSQGVEDKKDDEAAADAAGANLTGKSEQGGKDTTHPTKNASALEKAAAALDLLTKALAEPETKVAAETAPVTKTAAEEQEALAKYASELERDYSEIVEAGSKFAEHVLGVLADAAQATEQQEKRAHAVAENAAVIKYHLKKAMAPAALQEMGPEGLDAASLEIADAGVDPAELESALAAQAPETGISLEELQALLEQAGITPEELAGAVDGGAGAEGQLPAEDLAAVEGQLSEDEQLAALEQAMGGAGVDEAGMKAAGAKLPADFKARSALVKVAADKTAAFVALVNHYTSILKGITK